MVDRPLHSVRRVHLEELGGPIGIWQHAIGSVPDQSFGYCTDDVARALIVDLLHRHAVGWEGVGADARRSLTFLREAFDPARGAFRNFRDADGSWVDAVGSEDCQARALRALGLVAVEAPEAAMRAEAASLFQRALPGIRRLTALRAVSAAILACDVALSGGLAGGTERTFAQLAWRLHGAFAGVDLDGDWPWPEAALTYENALVPHALIVASGRLAETRLRRAGLRVLDWLVGVQTSRAGEFSPIGCNGWWPRGGTRSRFDQQPIEATTMILAASAALGVTGDQRYRRVAEMAYGWFLGDNDAGIPVADTATGGCHDGLSSDRVNANEGAESTLMWLIAVEHMRRIRSRRAPFAASGGRRVAQPAIGLPS